MKRKLGHPNRGSFPPSPQLDEQFLRNYQVCLSPSYIHDNLLRSDINTEKYGIHVDAFTNENGFMRFRIFARFRNFSKQQLWIVFDDEHQGGEENGDPILGHYCICKSGARTIGAWAHVTAICCYQWFARHQTNQRYPQT